MLLCDRAYEPSSELILVFSLSLPFKRGMEFLLINFHLIPSLKTILKVLEENEDANLVKILSRKENDCRRKCLS